MDLSNYTLDDLKFIDDMFSHTGKYQIVSTKGEKKMEKATKFMDGNLYRGFYIVSAKKCQQTNSQKGFSIFKIENEQPIWDELDQGIINMNLAKARVDILAETKSELVPKQAATIDSYLFKYIPQKHKDSIKAIYKDGKVYFAELKDGTTVTGITNWDSFKRAIRRAIEG